MMKSHLLLVLISIFLGACQVKEEIASINSSSTTSEVSNEFVVTTSFNGWKKKNDVIQITLSSLKKIHKMGTSIPYIEAIVGSNVRKFNYASGTGTNSITFNYTVVSADLDIDGIDFAGIVSLNGSLLQLEDDAGNKISAPTNLNFKPTEILVDGSSPFLESISYPEAKAYSTNDTLTLSLVFNENIKLKQDVSFIVSLDSGPKTLNYFSGNGTKTLTFKGALNSLDSDTDGTIDINELDFSTQLTDQAGNAFVQLLNDSAVDDTWVNLVKPKITEVKINNVSPPTTSTYTLGQNIDINLKFDYNVVLLGNPRLNLQLYSGAVKANFLSQSPANQLNFRYTVKSGDLDSDGILLSNFIELNGATLKSAANTLVNADLFIPAIDTSMVKVSAPQPLNPIYATGPLSQVYKLGDILEFTLYYNRPITVNTTTPPSLNLVVGSTPKIASYDSAASGPQSAVFKYTVATNDLDTDGIVLLSTITNPSSITDSYLGSSSSTFMTPATNAVTIDASPPLVSSISVPDNGTYNADQDLLFSVTMSEKTFVTGTPRIKLTIGTTGFIDVYATYSSGSGTNKLLFKYPVSSPYTDFNGIEVDTTLDMSGGSFKDQYDNTITTNQTLSPPPTTGVLIDASIPSITSTTLTGALPKTFKLGEHIDFNVTFNKAVQVSGEPCIYVSIASSSPPKCAKFNPGLSTSTVLKFRYTVQNGDNDGDDISIPSSLISLSSNQHIKDSAGNNAILTFTPPTLTSAKIDALSPKVTSIVTPTSGVYATNDSLTFKLNWSESITVTGTPKLMLKMNNTDYDLDYLPGSSTTTQSVFKINLTTNGLEASDLQLSPMIVFLGTGEIKDQNGNLAEMTFTSPNLAGIGVNTIRPAITTISSSTTGLSKAGDILTFTLQWTKGIYIQNPGAIYLKIKIGSTEVNASYKPGLSGYGGTTAPTFQSVFQYTILPNQADSDGVTALELVVTPDIEDQYGNKANISFGPNLFPDTIVDAVIPTSSYVTANARSYKAGDVINFIFGFSEPMKFTGSPFVNIMVGTSTKQAFITTGMGTNELKFSYTVEPGINDSDGLEILGDIQLGAGGSLTDLANNSLANLTPLGSITNVDPLIEFSTYLPFPSIKIDNTPPSVSGTVKSENKTRTSLSNYFIPGDIMEFSVTFNEQMTIQGSPRIGFKIGNIIRYATYYEPDPSTTIKKFRYTVDSGNIVLDLDGIELNSSIDLDGGSITDLAGNPLSSLAINYTETDYVYFNNMVSRHHVKTGAYTVSGSNVVRLNDMTGNGNYLEQTISSERPTFSTSGFGTNSTGYATFSAGKGLRTTTSFGVRYAFFAAKTTPTIAAGTQEYGLISQAEDVYYMDPDTGAPMNEIIWNDTLRLGATSTTKSVLFNLNGQVKFNNGAFNNTLQSTISDPALWAANTNYVMVFKFQTLLGLEVNSIIGATGDEFSIVDSFEGDVAEMIFVNGTLNDTQINLIRDQLNEIHGIY